MRTALALLVAATGCNQIFGVKPTVPVDAAPGDGPKTPGSISWMQLDSHPLDEITYPAIAGIQMQAARLGQPLADVPFDPDGIVFELPNALTDKPYRVVYPSPADAIPQELQLEITDGPQIVVPLLGRTTRTAAPTSSGWTLQPVIASGLANDDPWPCLPTPPNPPCISQGGTTLTAFTTGSWLRGGAAYSPYRNKLTIDATGFKPAFGDPDSPSSKDQDLVVVVHYDGTQTADAYGFIVADPLSANMYNAESIVIAKNAPTGSEARATQTLFFANPIQQGTQIAAALGSTLYNFSPAADSIQIDGGVIPDIAMPSMSLPNVTGAPDDSVFIPLFHEEGNPGTTACDTFVNPFTAVDQEADQTRPQVARYREYNTRLAAGPGTPTLYSGYQMITTRTREGACNGSRPPVQIGVGIAENVTFGTALSADNTAVTLPSGGYQDLTFALSDGGANTTDCTVTVYRVDTASLVPLHAYRVAAKPTNMKVSISTAELTNGATHVFGIACGNAYPNAKLGDFRTFGGYPQEQSLIYPGTFVPTLQ